jgi:hypothetical protein
VSTVSELDSADAPAAVGAPAGTVPRRGSAKVGRRLYLPTIVIAGLAVWLSLRGWHVLAQVGPVRSINAGRLELAGPAVIGGTEPAHPASVSWKNAGCGGAGRPDKRSLNRLSPQPVTAITVSPGQQWRPEVPEDESRAG